jgi:Uncharacterized conserved protein
MRRWTHQDRDIVTPANDFLYLNAWIDLTDGPVVLDIPAVDEDRYYVIELLDAFTNNFVNLSPLNAGSSGKRYVLHRERGGTGEPERGADCLPDAPRVDAGARACQGRQ